MLHAACKLRNRLILRKRLLDRAAHLRKASIALEELRVLHWKKISGFETAFCGLFFHQNCGIKGTFNGRRWNNALQSDSGRLGEKYGIEAAERNNLCIFSNLFRKILWALQ